MTPFTPTPAPLPARIGAGLVDAAVLLVLCTAAFLVPLLLQGVVLPMWGVLLAVLAGSVVPLAAFRRTLGFVIFRLELVGKDGHAVGAGDVLFRELLGRGYFPAAFLFTVLAGALATLFVPGLRFSAPTGLTAFFAFASMIALGFAIAGHFVALASKDGRSLADLLARSYVVPARPTATIADEDEAAFARGEQRRRLWWALAFEVFCLGGALGLPWLMTVRTESTAQLAQRLTVQKLSTQLQQDPDNEALARQYLAELRRAQDFKTAAEVEAHLTALEDKHALARLDRLRTAFADQPGDEATFLSLLGALEERELIDEAAVSYRHFLDRNGDDELRAGFGRWLWRHGRPDEGLVEVDAVARAAPGLEGVRSLRGQLLAAVGRAEDAQLDLSWALLEDPEDDEAADALNRVNASLGPLAPAKQKKLEADFKAWTKVHRP